MAVQLAAIPVLARLLDPDAFGLIAMVMVLVSFGGMFVDAGMATATIQRDRVSRAQVSNLHWLSTALGGVIGLLVAALAPAVAWFYGRDELLAVTVVLAGTFLLAGASVQPAALLHRAMQFRVIAVVNLAGIVLGQAASIAVAAATGSYWALVMLPVVSGGVRLIGLTGATRFRPSRPRRGVGTRKMVDFGAKLTGANFINFFARNADNTLIGWWWGATPLGFYERAYKLLLFPLQQVNGPMGMIAVPALSRLRGQPERYRSFFRRGLWFAGSIQIPLAVFGFAAAPEVVGVMLGPDFAESVPIFRALFPAALMAATAPATGWVYSSWGHGGRLLKMVLANTAVTLIGFAISIPHGPTAVAASFSASICLSRIPSILYCFGPTPLRLRDVWEPLRGTLLAAAAGAGCAFLVDAAGPESLRLVPRLLTKGAAFGLAFGGVWLSVNGTSTLRRSIRELRPAKPHDAAAG